MLLDTNIIIYASKPEHAALRTFVAEHAPGVSAVSYVEALGYHAITPMERSVLEAFFSATRVYALDTPVLEQAVRLRQQRRMSLGDALVAGTALTHRLVLVTRNVSDFEWVPDLQVLDPLADR